MWIDTSYTQTADHIRDSQVNLNVRLISSSKIDAGRDAAVICKTPILGLYTYASTNSVTIAK